MKMQAKIMFKLDLMNKNVANFHKSVVTTCMTFKAPTLIYGGTVKIHIFAVRYENHWGLI